LNPGADQIADSGHVEYGGFTAIELCRTASSGRLGAVLDEPLASLDSLARHDFMASVMAGVAGDDVSVVLSSHVLAELERVADPTCRSEPTGRPARCRQAGKRTRSAWKNSSWPACASPAPKRGRAIRRRRASWVRGALRTGPAAAYR
jgi:hypothetical protein